MEAPLVIVWRESVEALLVIGILYAWLRRENLEHYVSRLWVGTGLGIVLAAILATLFWVAGNWVSGPSGDWFFTFMMTFAALLILQMVVWMHRNGGSLKRRIEEDAAASLTKWNGWGIAILAMIAVAREGSETVVFLSGVGAQQQGSSLSLFILGGIIGFVFALITFWLLQKFASIISWKQFFLISEFVLLLIGGGLLVTAFDKAAVQIEAYDLPNWMFDFIDTPIWDTSWLIPDQSNLTGLTGYHAQPSLLQVCILALYWIGAILLCVKGRKSLATRSCVAST